MKKILALLLLPLFSFSQFTYKGHEYDIEDIFKNQLKFSTIYGAVNGGTSISDVKQFSIIDGLQTSTIETPYDYSITLGIRKIARFGHENKAQTFYDGTESNYTDAATVGKVQGFEYLFEIDYARQQGIDYIDQHHFIRYSSDDNCDGPLCIDHFAAKVEYLKDGFADIEYFELSERYRYKQNKDLAFSVGLVHRLAEPYGYDPLAEWMLSNGNLHYTYLALQEGYSVDVANGVYMDPSGNIVANSADVWKEVVIPEVLSDYTIKKRNELEGIIQHSIVVGFDYYKYNKSKWVHAWGNIMPYHYKDGNEFSYHNYIEDDQWYDYSGGVIFGQKLNKQLGIFAEGKYSKYWNREWYDFKLGINYIIR